jgi:hypothetical protein
MMFNFTNECFNEGFATWTRGPMFKLYNTFATHPYAAQFNLNQKLRTI